MFTLDGGTPRKSREIKGKKKERGGDAGRREVSEGREERNGKVVFSGTIVRERCDPGGAEVSVRKVIFKPKQTCRWQELLQKT